MQKKAVNQVYWEQQGIDQLCGVHTINSLLQGPYFNEIQMAEIGMQLDQQEKALGAYGSGQKSANVANDGNFSIQVLSECLKQLNLTIESVNSKLNRNENMNTETGFICNSHAHWFAIRKVNGEWFNLNSCSVYGPQPISEFYLSAFLQNVVNGGYQIFVVKGKYPMRTKNDWPQLMKHQRYLGTDLIKRYQDFEKSKSGEGYALNIGAYDANNMENAIEESKKLADLVRNQEMPTLPEEKQQSFQGQGISLSDNTSVNYVNFQNLDVNQNEDPELLFVMQQSLKQSLADKFQQKPSEGISIRFFHPNGERSVWTFSENSFIEDLYDYAFFKMPDQDNYKFYLSQTHPTRKHTNLKLTLVEADIDDMDSIYITKQ